MGVAFRQVGQAPTDVTLEEERAGQVAIGAAPSAVAGSCHRFSSTMSVVSDTGPAKLLRATGFHGGPGRRSGLHGHDQPNCQGCSKEE